MEPLIKLFLISVKILLIKKRFKNSKKNLKSWIIKYKMRLINCKRNYKWQGKKKIAQWKKRTLESPAFFGFLRRDFRCLVTVVWPTSPAWSTVETILDSPGSTMLYCVSAVVLLARVSFTSSENSHDRLLTLCANKWTSQSPWWFAERQLMILLMIRKLSRTT